MKCIKWMVAIVALVAMTNASSHGKITAESVQADVEKMCHAKFTQDEERSLCEKTNVAGYHEFVALAKKYPKDQVRRSIMGVCYYRWVARDHTDDWRQTMSCIHSSFIDLAKKELEEKEREKAKLEKKKLAEKKQQP